MMNHSCAFLNYARLLALGGLLALPATLSADPLTRAKVTQTVNDVKISNASGANARPAKPGSTFAIPELLRTGPSSRAELIAPDKTVTRVGSNTVFSFKQGERGINLEQGSVLFHSPTGKGGGEIKTASATASVLGTTIIVAATSNGGFKFMVLEGLGKVIMPNGNEREIKAGNLTFIMPGANNVPQVFEFRLAAQTAGSALINGFNNAEGPVQSFLKKVQAQTETQEEEIASGNKEGTSLKIGDTLNETDIEIVDAGSRTAVFEAIVAEEFDEGESGTKPVNPFDPEECPNAYAAYELLCSPASVTSSTLDPSRVTTFDDSDELIKFLQVLGVLNDGGGDPPPATQLFTASQLNFDTPSLDVTANYPSLGFIGYSLVSFSQLLEITSDPSAELVFASKGLILMPNNTGIKADADFLELISNSGTLISGSLVRNDGGSIFMFSNGGILISDSTIEYSINGPSIIGLEMIAYGPLEIVGSTIRSLGSEAFTQIGLFSEDTIVMEDTVFETDSDIFIANAAVEDPSIPLQNKTTTKDVTLKNVTITAPRFYGEAQMDYRIEGTASNPSEHTVSNGYTVYANNGRLIVRHHTIDSGGVVTLGGQLDVSLESLDIKLTDFSSPAFYAESWTGDINITGGNHGLASGITNGPNRSYVYNAFDGNVRVNETGSQWTNFGSNDTSGGYAYFDFNGSQSNGTVHMRNANFLDNVTQISMQARTVNLENVNFAANSVVNLYSEFGMVNFGSSMQGYVNFINNVFHGQAPGSDLSIEANYNNFQSTNPGYINIYANGGGGSLAVD